MGCFALFMDESGAGSRIGTKEEIWTSAGVLSNLDNHEEVATEMSQLRRRCLRLYNKELKGKLLSANHLVEGVTKDDVARELAKIIKRYGMQAWVTAVRMTDHIPTMTSTFTPSNPKKGLQAKDVAREMLIERVSMDVDCIAKPNDIGILIWDLSDTGELSDFSSSILAHKNPFSGESISRTIIPHVLGGLSHEWVEIQIADLISNFAINYAAYEKYPDADEEKAEAFRKHLYPCLQSCFGKTDGYGWKYIE